MNVVKRCVVAATLGLVMSGLAACSPEAPEPTGCTGACNLASLGRARGIRIGAAVTANRLPDADYAAAVAGHFTAVTPEFDMKWRAIHPTPTSWNWDAAERIVTFAEQHDLSVRGHALVWGKASTNPDWLLAITDPAEFRSAVLDSIAVEVGHFAGRIDRWDVVNEPFLSDAAGLDPNVFHQRIGADYVDVAFHAAHAADPTAELWLNEATLERGHSRANAFVAFVASMVQRGVPIHGVGIQTHLISGNPLQPGVLGSVVSRLRALGLKVAITEMDVPTGSTRPASEQIAAYRQAADECFAAGCEEFTTWGVSDGATWLDLPATRAAMPELASFAIPSNPLLLDAAFRPKPAYAAVADALWARPLLT